MTIGASVASILSILRGWGNLPASIAAGVSLIHSDIAGLSQKINAAKAASDARLDAIDAAIADLKAQLGQPETGSFNPERSTDA